MSRDSRRIRTKRVRLFFEQDRKCFYCGTEMWEQSIERYQDARERFGLPMGTRDSRKRMKALLCTAEHLTRKADGGRHRDENLVAACADCNARRNDRTVEEHKEAMRRKHDHRSAAE